MTLDGTSGITQMTGSIVMSGSTSGTTTIIPSAVAGTTTVTMPAATGTMMVSGNMPAFSAYKNALQNLTTNTPTLVSFQTKEFDTASAYNNTGSTVGTAPQYSFNPQVAGYYQVNAAINANTTWTRASISIWKNGAAWKYPSDVIATTVNTVEANALVYLNGTTDYIQIYTLVTGASPQIYGDTPASAGAYTYFQACLVRGA